MPAELRRAHVGALDSPGRALDKCHLKGVV
jgi:hypothetical protein